jgi:hypothetical protein
MIHKMNQRVKLDLNSDRYQWVKVVLGFRIKI